MSGTQHRLSEAVGVKNAMQPSDGATVSTSHQLECDHIAEQADIPFMPLLLEQLSCADGVKEIAKM